MELMLVRYRASPDDDQFSFAQNEGPLRPWPVDVEHACLPDEWWTRTSSV
jgi:hypothetical protein